MRATKEGYDKFSKLVDESENASRLYHAIHKDEGISYKSDCPICK